MKVRWTSEPRALANPQLEVAPGDEIDVDDDAAESLIAQGLAEPVGAKSAKKENG